MTPPSQVTPRRRTVRVELTAEQATAVVVAIRSALESDWLPPGRAQALSNALDAIQEQRA